MNTSAAEGLVQRLLLLTVFRSGWLLWLLLVLAFHSVAVIVERWFYYRRREVNFEAVKSEFTKDLHRDDLDGAVIRLAKHNATESNVALAGLRGYNRASSCFFSPARA